MSPGGSTEHASILPLAARPWIAALLVAGLAFAWTFACGRRGFFPLDHSIVLDGAWRLTQGQVPYTDFRAAFGLTAMVLAGGWFAVFGTGFASFLACAAALDALAALVTIVAVRRLTGGWGPALVAGVLTGIWLQPPFGLPYGEQTAFLFGLLGLAAAVFAVEWQRPILWLATGACLTPAFLSKQNAGALLLLPFLAWLCLERRRTPWRRSLSWLFAGLLASAGAFALWLVACSDPQQFVDAVLGTPSGLAAERARQHFPHNLVWLLVGKGNAMSSWTQTGLALLALAALPRSRATGLCLALLLYQHAFNVTSNARPENGYAFAGWIGALSLAACRERGGRWRPALAAVLVAVLAAWGLWTGWSRRIHEPLRGADFTGRIEAPGWGALRWAEPTRIHGAEIRAADVNAVVAHLARRGPFLVFPDFTALYAMLGRPSPQPLLWFHWNLTSPGIYDPALDIAIVRGLEASGVDTIVFETVAWMDAGATLGSFPRLAAYLGSFRETARYGIFRVLEK